MNDKRFAALFQHASMGILVADDKGVIEMANNFLLLHFGYEDAGEIVGKKVEILIPSRYSGTHEHHRENYNKKPAPRSMGVGRDLFAIRKDGTDFPVEVSLSNYTLDDKMYVIAFVIDITTRKEIENAIILQKEQLADNNIKIEELNQDLEKKVELRTGQLQETMHQLEASKEELTKALSKEKRAWRFKKSFCINGVT